MSDALKVAVIGTGSLGKEHARLYSDFDSVVQLAGVCDVNPAHAERVAERCRTRVLSSVQHAADSAEAFSVVTPTNTHFEIAKFLLDRGKHVLVEKPMTENSAQAA